MTSARWAEDGCHSSMNVMRCMRSFSDSSITNLIHWLCRLQGGVTTEQSKMKSKEKERKKTQRNMKRLRAEALTCRAGC